MELCALAKRVPKPGKASSQNDKNRLEKEYNAMVNIIQHLELHPELKVPCYLDLVNGKVKADVGGNPAKTWPRNYNCPLRTPKYYKAQIIVAASQGSIDKAEINRVNSKDPEAIHMLFTASQQAPDNTHYDKEMVDHDICGWVLLKRAEDVHGRLKLLKDRNGILPDGTIVWPKLVGYTFVLPKNPEVDKGEIVHASGDRAPLPQRLGSMTNYGFEHFLDHKVELVVDEMRMKLADKFTAGTGPWKTHIEKPASNDTYSKIAQVIKSTPAGSLPTPIVPDQNYLSLSEQEQHEKRREQAKRRLSERQGSIKRARSQSVLVEQTQG